MPSSLKASGRRNSPKRPPRKLCSGWIRWEHTTFIWCLMLLMIWNCMSSNFNCFFSCSEWQQDGDYDASEEQVPSGLLEDSKYQVLELPYQGRELGLVILLPDHIENAPTGPLKVPQPCRPPKALVSPSSEPQLLNPDGFTDKTRHFSVLGLSILI